MHLVLGDVLGFHRVGRFLSLVDSLAWIGFVAVVAVAVSGLAGGDLLVAVDQPRWHPVIVSTTKIGEVSTDARPGGGRPGEDAFLAAYDPSRFRPFALTVDLNIFTIRDGVLCVLLIERGGHPYLGYWALPGGHVEQGRESADTAAPPDDTG